MGLELDWLEREERYRRRVVRLMGGALLVVGIVIGVAAYMGSKRDKASRAASAQAAATAREAAAKAKRDAFVADSSAAANRYAGFLQRYGAVQVETLPLLEIPLARGRPSQPFVRQLWSEYVRVLDPKAGSQEEAEWYRQYYVDLMNDGPLRGRAVLLPSSKLDVTRLVMQKPNFTDITRAQIVVGMREEAPADTTLTAGGVVPPPTGGGTPATLPEPAPPIEAAPPKPKPTPAAPDTTPPPIQASTPVRPVPAAPVPPDTVAPPESIPKP